MSYCVFLLRAVGCVDLSVGSMSQMISLGRKILFKASMGWEILLFVGEGELLGKQI